MAKRNSGKILLRALVVLTGQRIRSTTGRSRFPTPKQVFGDKSVIDVKYVRSREIA